MSRFLLLTVAQYVLKQHSERSREEYLMTCPRSTNSGQKKVHQIVKKILRSHYIILYLYWKQNNNEYVQIQKDFLE